MSWSEHFRDVTREEIRSLKPENDHTLSTDESREQWDAALKCVIDIVYSNAVSTQPDHKFHVSMHGHANSGHEPTTNWANDTVGVSVAQA